MVWENGIETCIISYEKLIATPGSMHDTGCLGLVHLDDPEGWYREEGGRGVQDGEHVYTRGGFMLGTPGFFLCGFFFFLILCFFKFLLYTVVNRNHSIQVTVFP